VAYSEAVQILVDEHEVILSVLDAVDEIAHRDFAAGGFPQDFFEKAFDFFPAFADKCHHAKEEGHLFPVFEARGIPRAGGPLGCMLQEHDEGRAHVMAVREALHLTKDGNTQAQQVVRREALAYAELLRQHIFKENQILFVMGDRLLTDRDKVELLAKFNCAEHSALPPGAHEKYIALAKELRAMAGLAPVQAARPTCTSFSCEHHG
jgi:hemerythrin-like domain-containing protein